MHSIGDRVLIHISTSNHAIAEADNEDVLHFNNFQRYVYGLVCLLLDFQHLLIIDLI
jgi:hypothetical protein